MFLELSQRFPAGDGKDTVRHGCHIQLVNVRGAGAALLEFFAEIEKGVEAFRQQYVLWRAQEK